MRVGLIVRNRNQNVWFGSGSSGRQQDEAGNAMEESQGTESTWRKEADGLIASPRTRLNRLGRDKTLTLGTRIHNAWLDICRSF